MRGEEHVGGLEVAVHDAAGVERAEGGQDREGGGYGLVDEERSPAKPLAQGLAVEQLHGDEETSLLLADLVELADVRMVDAGGGLGFAPEALARGLVVGQAEDGLDGQAAVEALVAGGVDDAHPSLSQLAQDEIGADAQGGLGGWRVRGPNPPPAPGFGQGSSRPGDRAGSPAGPEAAGVVIACSRLVPPLPCLALGGCLGRDAKGL